MNVYPIHGPPVYLRGYGQAYTQRNVMEASNANVFVVYFRKDTGHSR